MYKELALRTFPLDFSLRKQSLVDIKCVFDIVDVIKIASVTSVNWMKFCLINLGPDSYLE
jgi:hypothetical protein